MKSNYEERPWGSFETLVETDSYKVKRIQVKPGCRLSLQKHKFRAERWTIVQGEGIVTINDDFINVTYGDSLFIETGAIHRVENKSDLDLVFIEIQIGSYFGEDDIIRIEDDFGRV